MAQLPTDEAIARLKQNEDRFDKFVNDETGYTSSGGASVESIQEFLARVEQTIAAYGTLIGFPTLAALNAALAYPAGTMAYVTNDATTSNNGYYIKSGASGSGAWTRSSYDPVNNLSAEVDVLKSDFYSVVDYKNKFNPSLAEDGKLIDYATGTTVAYATGMAFGKQDVTEGNSYVWSMPASGPGFTLGNGTGPLLYCYNSSGSFIGLSRAISANPVAPTPPTGIALSDSNKTLKFTIPVGSGIAKVATMAAYTTHDTAAFNNTINGMQLEIGASKTAYEPYKTLSVNEDNIPATIARVADITTLVDAAFPQGASSQYSGVSVSIDGTYAYVRTKWNSTLDLVQRIQYGTNTPFANNVVNPQYEKTIPSSTALDATITAYASGTTLVSQGDDAAPCQYNGTYIGANHGAFFVHEVTVTGHGKAVQDVGSQWSALGTYFTILRIVDVNKLWLLSENSGGAQWNFITTSLADVFLSHHSGATNTGSFTPSADALTQLLPAIKSHSKTIRLDGRVPVTVAGTYSAEFVDIVDAYDICNPVSVLSYIQSQAGGSVQPGFTDSPVASDARVCVTYRYGSNGSVSVHSQFQSKSALTLQYLGFIQALPLTYAGKSLVQYIPKVNPIVGSLNTWNFEATEDITSQVEAIYLTTARWKDADNPPDRMAQIVKNGSTKEFGHVIGYGLQRGAGVPATRKLNINDAGFLYTSRKMYPKGITGSAYGSNLMPANTIHSMVAYRCMYNFEAIPEATVFAWYYDGDDIVIILDFHQSVTAKSIPLPSWMIGKTATLIDNSTSFSLLTPIVNEDGIVITVTGGYGQASIRVR